MKNRKSKLLLISLLTILFSALSLWLLTKERSGTARNYRDLPGYGDMLTDYGGREILYQYNPNTKRLRTKTTGTSNLFHDICQRYNLQDGYYKGDATQSTFLRVDSDPEFIPDKTGALLGYGPLYKEGRTVLHVYMEDSPLNETNSTTTIYLHIN